VGITLVPSSSLQIKKSKGEEKGYIMNSNPTRKHITERRLLVGALILITVFLFTSKSHAYAPSDIAASGWGPYMCFGDGITPTGGCEEVSGIMYKGFQTQPVFIQYLQNLGFVNDPDYIPGGGAESTSNPWDIQSLDQDVISAIMTGVLQFYISGLFFGAIIRLYQRFVAR
jgi:hypothetical protein